MNYKCFLNQSARRRLNKNYGRGNSPRKLGQSSKRGLKAKVFVDLLPVDDVLKQYGHCRILAYFGDIHGPKGTQNPKNNNNMISNDNIQLIR